ncbi:MAG: urease accessory protein UreF [Desulfopila sp.]
MITPLAAITMTEEGLRLVRLLQLVSPTLPTGSFSYSQGLEWAVEAGWVRDAESLGNWLTDCLHRSLARVDIPILSMMYGSCRQHDLQRLVDCCDLLLACRESRELRAEEQQRGRAMATLLAGLDLLRDKPWQEALCRSQLAGFAFAAAGWRIEVREAAVGYLWAWLENQVLAGVKIIPLGQTAGQLLLLRLGEEILATSDLGLGLAEEEIGASSMALALASSLHEAQYTRLYRS